MNEQYLWDRTGDDPEIKRLEEALAGFRYKEIAPPLLPVTTAAAEPRRLFSWRFSLPLAFAAAAVVISITGAWLLIGGRVNVDDVAFVEPPTVNISAPLVMPNLPDVDPSNGFNKSPERQYETRKVVSTERRKRRLPVFANKNKKEVVLTPEEKDAYSRLLLALSITGSKLRIVTDTINRTDEDTTLKDPNNR